MTPTAEKSQLALLIVLLLLSVVTLSGESSTSERSAFVNRNVTFLTCEQDVQTFAINGQYPWTLEEGFQSKLTFDMDENCHFLTFPALIEYDNATVSFVDTHSTEVGTFLLHVQGKPSSVYLSYKDVNSTHIMFIWDEPFSWVNPGNISYDLTLTMGTDSKTIRLDGTSFIIARPSDVLTATLTTWNPVGRGGESNLSISFPGCDTRGEIIPRVHPYQEGGGVVSVNVFLFSLQESILYCLPDTITVVHDNVEKQVQILYNKSVAYSSILNVTAAQHVTDLLIRWMIYLQYSTYKVQDVSVTGDSYDKTITCHFLNGSEDQTCLVDVEGEGLLSGSNVYTFTTPGHHTLKVYDDGEQRENRLEPAKVLNITINEDGGFTVPVFTWGIPVGVLGACVILVLLIVGPLRVCMKRLRHHSPTEVATDNTGPQEGTELQQQHGSAMDDGENLVLQATAVEHDKDNLEIGMETCLQSMWTVGRHHLLSQRVTAHHRSEENHVAIRIEEPEHSNQSIQALPIVESQQVSSDKEKELEVMVEGVEIPELHRAPVEENAN